MLQRTEKTTAVGANETVWHLTAISNLPQILGTGRGLLAKALLQRSGLGYQDISMQDVQRRRQQRQVFGYSLHHYVPLFFCQQNPMMYCLKAQALQLVWLEIAVTALPARALVTSDGNAACGATQFCAGYKPDFPDWRVLTAPSWHDLTDGKRKRAAELLCLSQVPAQAIRGLQVAHATQQRQIAGYGLPVSVNPRAFFLVN